METIPTNQDVIDAIHAMMKKLDACLNVSVVTNEKDTHDQRFNDQKTEQITIEPISF